MPRHGKYFAFPGKQGFPANVASTAIYRFFWASQKPCSLQGKTHFWDPNRPAFGHNGPLFFEGRTKTTLRKPMFLAILAKKTANLGPQTWVVSCILGTGFSANFEPTAIYRAFWMSQKPCKIQGQTQLLGPKTAIAWPKWPKTNVFWGSKTPSKTLDFLAILTNTWPIRDPKFCIHHYLQGFRKIFHPPLFTGFSNVTKTPCKMQSKTHFSCPKSASFQPKWPKPWIFWGSKKTHPQKPWVFDHFGQKMANLGPQKQVLPNILRGFLQILNPPLFTGFLVVAKNLQILGDPHFLGPKLAIFRPKCWPTMANLGPQKQVLPCIYKVFGKFWIHRHLQGFLNVAKTLQHSRQNPRPTWPKPRVFWGSEKTTLKRTWVFGFFGQRMASLGPRKRVLPCISQGFGQNLNPPLFTGFSERRKNPAT